VPIFAFRGKELATTTTPTHVNGILSHGILSQYARTCYLSPNGQVNRERIMKKPPAALSESRQGKPAGTKCTCCGNFVQTDVCQCDYEPDRPFCSTCGNAGRIACVQRLKVLQLSSNCPPCQGQARSTSTKCRRLLMRYARNAARWFPLLTYGALTLSA